MRMIRSSSTIMIDGVVCIPRRRHFFQRLVEERNDLLLELRDIRPTITFITFEHKKSKTKQFKTKEKERCES